VGKQLADLRAALDTTSASVQEMLRTQTQTSQETLADALGEAEESNRRINTILGIVADKGLVGQYNLAAKRERRSVLVWRVLAAVVALAAIVFAIEAARHADQVDDGSWRPLVAKLAVTLVVAGLAAYCGSVANDHRRAEQTAERVALQLAAIKPYLQDIANEELRDQVMVSTAARIFGVVHADEVGNVPGPSLGSHAAAQVSDELTKLVEKLIDARLKGSN
jgi:hypothetical protein